MTYTINVNKMIFIIVFIILSGVGFAGQGMEHEEKASLEIKHILIPQEGKAYTDYELGRKYISDYSFHGLPETFLIKKQPGLSIQPEAIDSIEIKRMPYIPPDMLNFQITINLNKTISEKLYRYTQKLTNEKIAFALNCKVFHVVTIMEPIKNGRVSFSIIEKPFADIYNILRQNLIN